MNCSIGTDDDDRSISVTISDDNGFNPDCLEMAATRATTHALWLWRELHPEAVVNG